jgi:hypothetical protein
MMVILIVVALKSVNLGHMTAVAFRKINGWMVI